MIKRWVSFHQTDIFTTLLHARNKIVLLCTGNRFGKTLYLSRKATLSILGLLPVDHQNISDGDLYRTIRFGAKTLPSDSKNETRNTVYPVFKENFPLDWGKPNIVKDIVARNATVAIKPPKGDTIHIEFVSYGQEDSSHAGVDRKFVFMDEVAPYPFYEESLMRIIVPQGQIYIGCTPVDAGWMYNELYTRAKTYIRTKTITDYIFKTTGEKVPIRQDSSSTKDICVIQAATDDNPLFSIQFNEMKQKVTDGIISKNDFPFETVSDFIENDFIYDDPDTIAMRRYGIFKNITGAVYKCFSWGTHVIEGNKYFPHGIPSDWKFARMIDYHQSVPWAIVFIAISPDNEAFVWEEMNPDPHSITTQMICEQMILKSKDYRFRVNLIDKLASEKQVNTNTSTTEDINNNLRRFGRLSWDSDTPFEAWDDKTTIGEDKIRERLINSLKCSRPFNNIVEHKDGIRLPTLWIFSNCKETANSLKNWKMEEWVDRDAFVSKDKKDKKEMKWSHFNKCLEAVFKDSRFRPMPEWSSEKRESRYASTLFKP